RRRRSSRLEPQVRLADPQHVAGGEPALAREADAVHEGAVRRADVLDPDPVPPGLDPRVAGRRVLVVRQRHVVRATATEGDRLRVERDLVAALERRAREDDQAAERASRKGDTEAGRGRLLRPQDHRLLGQAEVAGRRPDDPPDEQVEEDEEREFQRQEGGLDGRGRECRHYCSSRVKTISVEPIVNRDPSSSFTRFTRFPPTSTPFVESRSTSQYVAPSCRSSACRRDTFGSVTCTSASLERPSTSRRFAISCRCPFQLSTATSRWTPSSTGDAGSVGCATGTAAGLYTIVAPGSASVGGPSSSRPPGCTIRVAIPKTPTSRSSSVSNSTRGGVSRT